LFYYASFYALLLATSSDRPRIDSSSVAWLKMYRRLDSISNDADTAIDSILRWSNTGLLTLSLELLYYIIISFGVAVSDLGQSVAV